MIGGSLSKLIVPDPPPPSEESVTISKKEYEQLIEVKTVGNDKESVGGDRV